jgi:polysaccharide export outer membrane protein
MSRLFAGFCVLLAFVAGAAAQTATYRLQPGDSISITVLQDSKLDRTVIVGPDGSISVPLAGHIQAGGQTLQAVESALKAKLQPSYNTTLDISVGLAVAPTTASQPTIFVTGEVNRPGSFPIGPQGTNTLQAIAMSGGFSPFAATRRIEVVRLINGQEVRYAFNYDDLVSGRDASGNIALRAGDVVVVPEKGLFGH